MENTICFLMKFSFPKLTFKNNQNKIMVTKKIDLPAPLMPISAQPEELTEIISDYEINLLNIIPNDIKKTINDANIELSIANPHVFITYDQEKGIYKYVLLEPPMDYPAFDIYTFLISEIERRASRRIFYYRFRRNIISFSSKKTRSKNNSRRKGWSKIT
jgi:hypothetical protein